MLNIQYGYNAIDGGGPTKAREQATARQGMAVPLTTGGISGDTALVRYGGSCQATASSLCCQVTMAGCCPACPAVGSVKHRSTSVTKAHWCTSINGPRRITRRFIPFNHQHLY